MAALKVPLRQETGLRRGMRRGLTIAAAACLAVAASPVATSDQLDTIVDNTQTWTTTGLPSKYSTWDVVVTPLPGEPGTLVLYYDSPALQRRTANTVFVPTRYQTNGPPLPVMYFLHGTVLQLGGTALGNAPAAEEPRQVLLENFPSQRDKAEFLVVAPDVDVSEVNTPNWCGTCTWIDGHDHLDPSHRAAAETVPAERVLYNELVPLVEALFNVRSDRDGRGIMGFSMGALGALLNGFRHPDRFAYVAAISGLYDIVDEPVASNFVESIGYLRDQGYGTKTTDMVWWRNFNPMDLARNMVGTGTRLMLSAGDNCLVPTDPQGEADCAAMPPAQNPFPTAIETMVRNNTDLSVRHLPSVGVPARQVRFSGIHGANNHRVYADVIVPSANSVFAESVPEPDRFSYRVADPRFGVWGYRFAVERGEPQFLSVESAGRNGRTFALRGDGTVATQTPPVFRPGRSHTVTYSVDGRVVKEQDAVADRDRRLRLTVNLDDAAFGRDPLVRVSIAPAP